jgi:hypothetical protein
MSEGESMRLRIPQILLALLAFTTLTGFTGQGRFSKPVEAGSSSPLLNQLREVVKPVYQLRGALFQLRLELIAADPANAADAPLLQPWLDMDEADAGYAALRFDTLRTQEPPKRLKGSASLAKLLGGMRERKAIEDSFVMLMDVPGMETGKAFMLPEGGIVALAASNAARQRIETRIASIQRVAASMQNLPAQIAAVSEAADAAWKQTESDAKKAGKGNLNGMLGTAVNVVGAVEIGQEVLKDIEAVPALVVALGQESVELSGVFSSLAGSLGGAWSGVNFGSIGGLSKGLPDGSAYDALKGLVPK